MTKDKEDALRCAEHLESWYGKQAIAATHLRRLVAKNESEREARIKAQEHVVDLQARIARADVELQRAVQAKELEAKRIWREDQARIKQLYAENEAKDALLRQAVEALDEWVCDFWSRHDDDATKLIAAIRQHLEGKA